MKRLHLVELEDLPWFPAPIRDAGTDFLQFVVNLGDPYAAVAARLRAAVAGSGAARIVDLCSGGGGPWRRLVRSVSDGGAPTPVFLTDKYPNVAAFRRAREASGGRLAFVEEPVDVTAVPAGLDGFRTLFSGFHHFPPAVAREILRDAVRRRQGIGVFELTQRSVRGVVSILFAPLMVLLFTPFIRPFRWSRLLFTYLVPIVPLFVLWDGLVSVMRTYTTAELREMVDGLGAEDYRWEIGEQRTRGGPVPITYLIGYPAPPAGAASAS